MATPALVSVRQLRRARLTLSLAVLIPTLLLTGAGVVLVTRADSVITIVVGIVVLAMCLAYIAGYVLSWIFVGKGASAALLQADFLSSVSHELRTPLTSIRLLIDALGAAKLSPEEARSVTTLLGQECDRLDVLVGRLLELARLDSGRHPFERRPVAVDALVRDALAAYDAATLTRPAMVTVHVEPGLALVGDHALLVRALVNLLHNAWKYTGDDKQISLTARSAGRKLEFVISDNGIGMARSEHAAVFERFTRSRAAIDRGTPGVGLGLAFVRAIARGHRGKAFARARRGGGTEFVFRIRRGDAAAAPALAPTVTPGQAASS